MESKYTCEKCGYNTNAKTTFYCHMHRRKHSCNKEYDKQILNLALEKIKTFETLDVDYQITYNENGYTLFIKRNCFNNPYFEDYAICYDKPNGLHIGFFAEWVNDNQGIPKRDKLKFSK